MCLPGVSATAVIHGDGERGGLSRNNKHSLLIVAKCADFCMTKCQRENTRLQRQRFGGQVIPSDFRQPVPGHARLTQQTHKWQRQRLCVGPTAGASLSKAALTIAAVEYMTCQQQANGSGSFLQESNESHFLPSRRRK